jgi:hypothetical protein
VVLHAEVAVALKAKVRWVKASKAKASRVAEDDSNSAV